MLRYHYLFTDFDWHDIIKGHSCHKILVISGGSMVNIESVKMEFYKEMLKKLTNFFALMKKMLEYTLYKKDEAQSMLHVQ